MNKRIIVSCLFFVFLLQNLHAAEVISLAARWTQFVQSLEQLHLEQLKDYDVVTSTRVGGYGGIRSNPEFYIENKYRDRATGHLLAVVQRENNRAALLHAIELYVYDEQGRVAREYIAAYLPDRRETPFQTLISVYAYPQGLRAFRQFDASDDLLFEYCEGTVEGKKVRIAWDDLEMPDDAKQIENDFIRGAYETCFANIPRTAGRYLNPLSELQ